MKPLHIFLLIFYVGVSKKQDSGEPRNYHHFVTHGCGYDHVIASLLLSLLALKIMDLI